MISIRSLEDIATLTETVDVECKLAAGQDGKGQLSADFWPTYSAFANTRGGVVFLGLKEKQGKFVLQGIAEPKRIVRDLFNTVNNKQKVSFNLITDKDVEIISINGLKLVKIWIPAANRKQRPIYLNGNPLRGNTFRRLHDGDRSCSDETVKRMLAEQVIDSRDTQILPGFELKDLNLETLDAYRNMLGTYRLDHPWNTLDNQKFVEVLRAYRRDHASGKKGLTLAGLLMFGNWQSILDVLPHYFLDYREEPEDKTSETRWLDRIVPDGTWSGNLFDFFLKTIRKVVADLKVPFVLKGVYRQDDTLIHRALREALVNTIIHADYSDRASILIIKDPAGFNFRNPGLLRIPAKRALLGGESDCRNEIMHQMFLMINLGERAGSGLPKIRQGWETAGHSLQLFDSFEPYDQTRLVMSWGSADSIRSKKLVAQKNDGKTPARIIRLLTATPTLTIPKLAAMLNLSEATIGRTIRELRKENRLERIGAARGGHWKVNIKELC